MRDVPISAELVVASRDVPQFLAEGVRILLGPLAEVSADNQLRLAPTAVKQ